MQTCMHRSLHRYSFSLMRTRSHLPVSEHMHMCLCTGVRAFVCLCVALCKFISCCTKLFLALAYARVGKKAQRAREESSDREECERENEIGLMIEILHTLKDPKLWELWYIPYYGQCRIYIINSSSTASP